MKKTSIHITAKEARSGCERILSLPGQETRLRVSIAPGTKDGQKIKVNNAVFRDENGNIRRSPLQVTIYIGYADLFTLYTNAVGAKMTTEGFDEITLGISPTDSIPIEARLINYDTGQQIDSKRAMLGDKITFSNIPNGTYYYVISCNGYKTAIPDSPFKLERDYSKESDILTWGVNLEKEEGQFSSAFKVRIQNANGDIMQDSTIYVRVVSRNAPPLNTTITHYPLYSDENGYLTARHNINNKNFYDLVDFQLYDDCYLEARLSGTNKFVRIQIQDGVGICTISR